MEIEKCRLCPRECGAEREKNTGFCGGGSQVKLARASLHFWEEPCISGKCGSGTVLFSGCSLKCCFCQNYKISSENFGKEVSIDRLCEIMLELQEQGAANINLVNPTHYVMQVAEALEQVKPHLNIPVVYNTGGYDKVSSLRILEGYVDIYLPDIKYYNSQISMKYSEAENYFEVAGDAVKEMFRQVGKYEMGEDGIMRKGMIIRHMILPGCRNDSAAIMNWISEIFGLDNVLVSLMSQYTPCFNSGKFKEINRRITTFEYNSVLEEIRKLSLCGFMQDRISADSAYTPSFELEGI